MFFFLQTCVTPFSYGRCLTTLYNSAKVNEKVLTVVSYVARIGSRKFMKNPELESTFCVTYATKEYKAYATNSTSVRCMVGTFEEK